jgi:exodeoxyribonuclease VII small subunit
MDKIDRTDITEEKLPENLTLEEAFGRLDALVEALEDREISLEDSFRTYQEGMELLKLCNDKIDQVEKKILVMNGDGGLDEF